MKTLRILVAAALLAAAGAAPAIVFEQREFADPEQRARYRTLVNELRCLVCQNQNLADSDAELAADLRREVYRMIRDGRSDDDIVEFMVARYGEFVLYRPPLEAKTVVLWIGPFVLGAGGLVLLILHLRRRPSAQTPVAPLTDEERARVEELLGAEDDR